MRWSAMHRSLTLFSGTLAILLLNGLSANGDDAGKAGPVRAALMPFVEQQDISGAVAVVGRKDGIVAFEVIGQRDIDKKLPMTKDTLFRIASMTKPITALGIMILVDEGKVAVDDPVEKYLPEFKGQMLVAARNVDAVTLKKPARVVTVRDLLTHTSGVTGRLPEGMADLYVKRNRSLAEAVVAFSQRPLEFEPGSKWAYCNPGIDTLGRIIEVVSGQSYEEFLQKRIFGPLGMADTTFYPTSVQLERAAVTYGKKDGQLIAAPNTLIDLPAKPRYPIPAGGLYSTGGDLAKLYQMMLHQGEVGKVRLLSANSVATMTKLQTGDLQTGFTPGMGWGLGWSVVRTPQGVTEMLSPGTYGHGGAFGTQAWIDPQKDLFVVLLIQRTGLPNSDASPMRKELQAAAVKIVK